MLDTALNENTPGSHARALSSLDTMPYLQWIALAMQRLQAQWPDADKRRLHDIADELFADPRSGMLEPRQAVEDWLCLLSSDA